MSDLKTVIAEAIFNSDYNHRPHPRPTTNQLDNGQWHETHDTLAQAHTAATRTAHKWVTTARRITESPNEPVVVRRNLTLAEAKSAAAYHATSHQEEK